MLASPRCPPVMMCLGLSTCGHTQIFTLDRLTGDQSGSGHSAGCFVVATDVSRVSIRPLVIRASDASFEITFSPCNARARCRSRVCWSVGRPWAAWHHVHHGACALPRAPTNGPRGLGDRCRRRANVRADVARRPCDFSCELNLSRDTLPISRDACGL